MKVIGYTPAREGDMRFIRHSWVESFRTSHYAGMIPMKDYFRIYHDILREIMDRGGVKVLVAYNPSHPTQIFGFCCYEVGFTLPMVHYVYIKEDFRQLPKKDNTFTKGLATMLLGECGIDPKEDFYYTFKTGSWSRLTRWGAPFCGGIYRPLFARFNKDEAQKHEKDHPKTKTHQREEKRCA